MGGMAQLFLATIDGPDGFSKQCVVKTILPEFASLPDFNEMFVTEAKVTAMLHHPNIVEIYDFGREQGRYYLAMEYVRGCSLHQLLREASRASLTLGPRIAVAIGSQMSSGRGHSLGRANHRFADFPSAKGCVPVCLQNTDCPVGQSCFAGECLSSKPDSGCGTLCMVTDSGKPIVVTPKDGGIDTTPIRPCGCEASGSSMLSLLIGWALVLLVRRLAWRQ